MDKDKIKFVILEFEADGASHDGAEIDAHVAKTLAVSDKELSAIHVKTNRGIFANQVDFVKADLTKNKLHEKVGESNGQNIYRITQKGLDGLAHQRYVSGLRVKAHGGGK